MSTLTAHASSSSSAPFPKPDGTDIEPDESWKDALRKKIEEGLKSMVKDAKDNLERQLQQPGLSNVEKEMYRAECSQAMSNIRKLAAEQFQVQLDRERQERRWASGIPMTPQWSQALVQEQVEIMARIRRGTSQDEKSGTKPSSSPVEERLPAHTRPMPPSKVEPLPLPPELKEKHDRMLAQQKAQQSQQSQSTRRGSETLSSLSSASQDQRFASMRRSGPLPPPSSAPAAVHVPGPAAQPLPPPTRTSIPSTWVKPDLANEPEKKGDSSDDEEEEEEDDEEGDDENDDDDDDIDGEALLLPPPPRPKPAEMLPPRSKPVEMPPIPESAKSKTMEFASRSGSMSDRHLAHSPPNTIPQIWKPSIPPDQEVATSKAYNSLGRRGSTASIRSNGSGSAGRRPSVVEPIAEQADHSPEASSSSSRERQRTMEMEKNSRKSFEKTRESERQANRPDIRPSPREEYAEDYAGPSKSRAATISSTPPPAPGPRGVPLSKSPFTGEDLRFQSERRTFSKPTFPPDELRERSDEQTGPGPKSVVPSIPSYPSSSSSRDYMPKGVSNNEEKRFLVEKRGSVKAPKPPTDSRAPNDQHEYLPPSDAREYPPPSARSRSQKPNFLSEDSDDVPESRYPQRYRPVGPPLSFNGDEREQRQGGLPQKTSPRKSVAPKTSFSRDNRNGYPDNRPGASYAFGSPISPMGKPSERYPTPPSSTARSSARDYSRQDDFEGQAEGAMYPGHEEQDIDLFDSPVEYNRSPSVRPVPSRKGSYSRQDDRDIDRRLPPNRDDAYRQHLHQSPGIPITSPRRSPAADESLSGRKDWTADGRRQTDGRYDEQYSRSPPYGEPVTRPYHASSHRSPTSLYHGSHQDSPESDEAEDEEEYESNEGYGFEEEPPRPTYKSAPARQPKPTVPEEDAEDAALKEAENRKKEAELRKKEAEARKKEAEARIKAEERRRIEEEARKIEEEAKKLEEEARRMEEEAKRKAEEARRMEEEAERHAEEILKEVQRREAEVKRREEEVARREAESKRKEEKQRQEEEEERRRKEEEERKRERALEIERSTERMRLEAEKEKEERRLKAETEERERKEREERERSESEWKKLQQDRERTEELARERMKEREREEEEEKERKAKLQKEQVEKARKAREEKWFAEEKQRQVKLEKQRLEQEQARVRSEEERVRQEQQEEFRKREEEIRRRADERKRQDSFGTESTWGGSSYNSSSTNAPLGSSPSQRNGPSPIDRSSTTSNSTWNTVSSGWSSTSKASSASNTSASSASRTSASTSIPTTKPRAGSTGSAGYASSSSPHPTTPVSESEWARRQAEQARKQQEAFRKEQERLEQERQARSAGRPLSAEELIQLFEAHERLWLKLSSTDELRWTDFPWPMVKKPSIPEDITSAGISAYILSPHYPEKDKSKTTKDRLKEHIRRWHPDRFETKLLPKVVDTEKEKVKEGAGSVVRSLNDLLTRSNIPNPFS